MSVKKALFVGCSFTADCGFSPENQSKYHWPHLLCQHTGHSIINIAIGGMSNHEIFGRTVEAISVDCYDLVVVMWSESQRMWGYCTDDNIDDFTILNQGTPKGFCSDKKFVSDYAKMHYAHFDNTYIGIKNWLLYSLALEKVLKHSNIQYIFVKGFDNYVRDFMNVKYNDGFSNIDSLKVFLDFDQRPDDFILKKVSAIQNLIQIQDHSHWLNLTGPAFYDTAVDLADDQLHPGPITNSKLADNIINFYNTLNEQSI